MFNAQQQIHRHTVWLVPLKKIDVTQSFMKENMMSLENNLGMAEQRNESQARWIWIGIVLALMGLQLAINVLAVVISSNQSDDEIVTDYYQKGINWDQRHQLKENPGK